MTYFKRFAVLGFALILAGQGCLGSTGVGTPEAGTPDGSNAGAPATKPAVATNNCDHPYLPLQQGNTITYQTTVDGKLFHYTQTVTANDGHTATLTYNFPESGVTMTQKIDCASDGIQAEGYLDFSSVLADTGASIETVNASGPILPNGLDVGSEWSNHFETIMKLNSPSAPVGEMKQSMDMTRHAVRREKVTVPAGTYDALVVEVTSQSVLHTPYADMPHTSSQTEYWVEGVGLVKSEATGGSTDTVEATLIVQ